MRVPVYEQQETTAPIPGEHVGLENVGAGGGALAQGVRQLGQGADAALSDVEKARYQAADLEVAHAHIALAGVRDRVAHGTTVEATTASATTLPTGAPGTPGAPSTGPAAVHQAAASVGGGDGIPAEGVLNAQGLKGVYASQPALDYLDKARDQIASKLSTPYAQRKFHAESEETLQAFHTAIEQHAAEQMKVAKEAGLKDFMAVGINFAANNYTDRAGVAQQMAAVDKSIDALADSPEQAEAVRLGFHQHIHEAVLNQYVANKDWQGAQSYLSQAKQDLGEHAVQFQGVIQTGVEKQQGDVLALKLTGAATDPKSGLVNTPKLIAAANAVPEAQRTDAFKESARGQLHLSDAQNVATAAGHFNTALSAYNKRQSLADVDPADQAWLQANDAKGWLSLKEIAARDAREANRGATQETPQQLQTFYELKDTYRALSPDELAKTDPKVIVADGIRLGLSAKRAGELAGVVVGMREKAPADNSSLTKSQNDEVMDALEESGHTEMRHGVLRVKKGEEQLRSKIEQEILKHQASMRGALPVKEKGYTLDGDDLQKFVGPMLAPVVTQKNLIFPDKTAPGILAPGYESQAIPPRDADQIRSALQAAGQDASPQRIQEVYRTHHGAPAAPMGPSADAAPVKVEDLAKDPQALSMLHPATRQAVARLAPKTIVLPELKLDGKPSGPKPIVLPEIKLTGHPPKKPEALKGAQ